MKTSKTITDLNAKFQQRVRKLTEEYDYQRLQAQTFADYLVALGIAYERERARINGGGELMKNDLLSEPEKLYVVDFSNDHLKNYLAYDRRDNVFFIAYNKIEKNRFTMRFTEKEIKDCDERYWLFAVEVVE